MSLDLYDAAGRQARVLKRGDVEEAGARFVDWDGRDWTGAPLPSGIVLCRLKAGEQVVTQRMTLLK